MLVLLLVALTVSSSLAQTTIETTTGQTATTTPAPTYSYCHGMTRQSCQAWNSGCYWCPIFGQGNNGTCHEVGPSNGAAPSGNFFCPYCQVLAQAVGVSCLQLDDNRCKYCYSNQQCMVATAQGCASCGNAESSTQCAAYGSANQKTLPGCQWCALTTTCYNPVNYQSNCHCSGLQRDQCLQFPSQCQYCSAINTCQSVSRPCERCSATYAASTCNSMTGCSWCTLSNQCYNQSNGNYVCPWTCNQIVDNEYECNNAPNCQYCYYQSSCLSTNVGCNSCSVWTNAMDCNSLTATNDGCSWCTMTSTCQLPTASCPTSCSALAYQYQCNQQSQCSYCSSTTSCQTVDQYCPTCSSYADADSCNYQSGCDWCWFTNQCQLTSNDYSCPTQCSSITTFTACNGAGAYCSWCYSDGSYSSGTGEQQCYDIGFCSSNNFNGLGVGGLVGVIIGSVAFCACMTTMLCLCCRRRRAAAAARAALATQTTGLMQGTVIPGSVIPAGSTTVTGATTIPVAYGTAAYTTAVPINATARSATETA